MSTLERTARTTLKRLPERGSFDRRVVDAILDEGLVCHLGFVQEGQPLVIPTIHARVGDAVYVHGSAASRALRTVKGGLPVCLTVTLVDGLVLARSAFHHSMNYRSVLLFGPAHEVTDEGEKQEALKAVVEHVSPGRWESIRWPSENELRATSVVRLAIAEGSAKVRTGPPKDDDGDYALPTWAGVLPLRLVAGTPVADPRLPVDVPLPEHVARYSRPGW